ncbi:MAG: MvaI/BcnI family restriction endonuclease [Patescibacteria group bacterium]
MTLIELQTKLKEIKKLGFIKTHRKGDTGIGKTLEDLLGIKENNIPLPDIGELAELKAYRSSSKSMLTLFTLEPRPKGGDRDRTLLDNFGYSKRDNGRSKELHSTLSCKQFNNQGLRLQVEKDKVRIVGKSTEIDIYWDINDLQNKFEAKLPALVYTLADSQEINGDEHFHYSEAYLLDGFNFERFKTLVEQDAIVVDFRMYYRPKGSVRNHGTAFRVKIRGLYNCFDTKIQLI